MTADAVCGILPIADDLGHGGGYAARHDVSAGAAGSRRRALRVVGVGLAPGGLYERLHRGGGRHHGRLVGKPLVPGVHILLAIRIGEMLYGVCDLLGVLAEKPSQTLRHVVAAEVRLGGVGEHGEHPRVGGNHHELPVEFEHVEGVRRRRLENTAPLRRNLFRVSQLGKVRTHRPPHLPIVEVGGRLARHRAVHRRGEQGIMGY